MIGSKKPINTGSGLGLLGRLHPAPTTRTPPLRGGLMDVVNALNPSADVSQINHLAGLMGLAPTALGGGLAHPIISPAVIPVPIRRNVFFSFYYDDDIRRSVIVRNSYKLRPKGTPPSSSFYDRSLWESSKRQSEQSLKALIRAGMKGSSVTCVLGGTHTWMRPYVRYEIAHSLLIRSGIFSVAIHNVKDPNHGVAPAGYNPLDFIGLEMRPDGKGIVVEKVDGEWQSFSMMTWPVGWPRWLPKVTSGYLLPLSAGARAYDYCLENGYANLPFWAQRAATEAGR